MTGICTYSQAKALKHALAVFGISVKDETFEMTTSGIYIPRWIGYSRIPHEFDRTTGIAKWYFYFRFEAGPFGAHPDINVGDALDFQSEHGTKKLAAHIKNPKRKP